MDGSQTSGAGTALQRITAFVAERTGASLSAAQISRLAAEVVRRLTATGRLRPGEPLKESDVERYLAFLRDPSGVMELGLLLASVAVHKTDLFRDGGQLEAFRTHVLHPLARAQRRPLRLWSAGCATGEEVATLLLMLSAAGANPESTVLGTDLSEKALAQARQLTFRTEFLRRIPATLIAAHVQQQGETFTLEPSLRAQATFAVHNLMDVPYPLPREGAFDVIFCRNVLIYFTPESVQTVVDRLAAALRPDGLLVLSAAEPLLDEHSMLDTVRLDDAFFYRRRAQPAKRDPVLERARARYTPTPSGSVVSREVRTSTPAPIKAGPDAPSPPAAAEPATAEARFEKLLEAAAEGATPEQTEKSLRQCLYLDPHFAQARYLLGMLIEQRGERADAANEYRRALAALRDGKARFHPFFLNRERLQQACVRALQRLGFPDTSDSAA